MKLFFVFGTVLGMLLAMFNDTAIILSFTVNRGYIATHLCEQRAIAGNTCQGCCQLKKKLNESTETSTATPPQPAPKHEDLQCGLVSRDNPLADLAPGMINVVDQPLFAPEPPYHTIDHPPQTLPLS